ncbi:hypothetical protein MASR2M70_06190 [Bacillota bacterium]
MANITDLAADRLPLNQLRKPFAKGQLNIFGMGDVGSTMLSGLFLLGSGLIHTIGIWDLNSAQIDRLETEYGQIAGPVPEYTFPLVCGIKREEFYQCDTAVFCASAGVPPVGHTGDDVRMMQFNKNRLLVADWAKQGAEAGFRGLMAIVSDPVDLLCKEAFIAARSIDPSWPPDRIRGYGLGVMHGRGCYYSRMGEKFAAYEKEGRAFGPHGKGLVLANSIEQYDDEKSLELTRKAAEANLEAREKGYKPFIAPALASGALSILATLAGDWHYSAVYMGSEEKGAYLGLRNRLTEEGTEIEVLDLPDKLYKRIEQSYSELCEFHQ